MKISYQEFLDLVQEAINAAYPLVDPMTGGTMDPAVCGSWMHRYCVENLWDDRAFVSCGHYCAENDPEYGLIPITLDETGEEPVVTLGDLVPMKLVAVSLDGSTQIDVDLESITFGEFQSEAWDGSKSRFTVPQLLKSVPRAMAAWARGNAKKNNRAVTKDDLHLHYKEPGGAVNLNGVRNALARASQVKGVPAATIATAVKELQRVLARSKKKSGMSEATQEAWDQQAGETFIETLQGVIEGEFDKENLVIRGHKILAIESKNKRRYPVDTQKAAIPVFEGAKAYLNHPKAKDMADARDVRDLIGEHRNVRVQGEATYSDLHLLDNPTVRDYVIPVAERAPHLIGSSIVVRAEMKAAEDGIPEATKILACRSIDLVAEPATTKGLYEGIQQDTTVEENNMEMKDLTLEALKKDRPDLIQLIVAPVEEAKKNEVATMQDALKVMGEKFTIIEARQLQQEKALDVKTLVAEANVPVELKYEEKEVDGAKVKVIKANILGVLEACTDSAARRAFISQWEGMFVGSSKPKPQRESEPVVSTEQHPVATGIQEATEETKMKLFSALA